MAQSYYSVELEEIDFPFLSEQQPRTIMGTAIGRAISEESRPGIQYLHNVMPSKYGLDSVGFTTVIPIPVDGNPIGNFSDTRIVYGTEKSRIYLTWDLVGNIYALLPLAKAWIPVPDTIPSTRVKGFTSNSVTIGTVNGVSYIFFSKIGCFQYDENLNQLVPIALTGLDIPTVLGVVASSGYLIAYTNEDIAWSSTILPTDFVPSPVTGAGGGAVAGTEGDIEFCTPTTTGIIIYVFANAIAATYTGNPQYPFKFKPVTDSKGGVSLDKVAYEANSASQFVYSKAGLQTISNNTAANILPGVTDFLAGKRFEDFDEDTNQYIEKNLGENISMLKKIKFIASRYLIISYGLPAGTSIVGQPSANGSFTHAFVYDVTLNRLGKVKIEHADVFEYVADQKEVSKESIAFLLPSGEVKTLHSSVLLDSSGVLILGKLQATHGRMTQLLGTECENVPLGSTVTCTSMAALDGKKDITLVEGSILNKAGNLQEFGFRYTAKNHSIILKGRYNLVTVLVRYSIHGKR